MAKKSIAPANGAKPIGPYSTAIENGDLLFISGQIPIDGATGKLVPGDVSAQARQSMENLKAILAAAGMTFANVVKTTIFLTDMGDFAAVNEVYKGFCDRALPGALHLRGGGTAFGRESRSGNDCGALGCLICPTRELIRKRPDETRDTT